MRIKGEGAEPQLPGGDEGSLSLEQIAQEIMAAVQEGKISEEEAKQIKQIMQILAADQGGADAPAGGEDPMAGGAAPDAGVAGSGDAGKGEPASDEETAKAAATLCRELIPATLQ